MAQQGRTRGSSRVVLLLVLALVVLIAVLLVRAGQVRREYAALLQVTPVPTMAPPTLAYRQLAPMYRFGSVGPEVIALQERLTQLGYYSAEIDGKYYEGTQAAVKAFQLQHGLDADGIAGEITLKALNSADAQPYRVPEATMTPPPAPEGAYTTPKP